MLRNLTALAVVLFVALPALAAAAWVPVDGAPLPEKPYITVLSSDARKTVIEVATPGFSVEQVEEEGEVFQVLRLPGYHTTTQIGKPELPTITELVAVPASANVRVTIEDYSEVTLTEYNVYPFQTPLSDAQQATAFDIDRAFYSLDQFYPAELAEIGQPSIWRDLRVVNLRVHPLLHNPATGELRVLTRLTLTLEYYGTSDGNVLVPSGQPVSARYARMYRDAILNHDYLSIDVQEDTPLSGRIGYDYLIIAVDDYVDNMQPFIDWKNSKGLATQITPLSTIGADTAAIKAYITQEYNSNFISYVLLVGDYDHIPCYELWHYLAPNPPPCDSLYSDYYYATLTEDNYPEVAVGRFSVSNDAEADNMVSKSVLYESNPPGGDWLEKALLMTHKDGAPGKYEQCKEEIKAATYTGGTYDILYPDFDSAYGSQGFTNADVSALINDGRRVVNYRGHGGTACWGLVGGWNTLGQDYDTTDADGLTNGEKTPAVFAIACSSGQLQWGGGRCMGEAFTRGPQAGVAYLGASRPTWTTANHRYDKKIFAAIFDEGHNSAGDASNLAAIEIIDMEGVWGLDNARLYLWFGDPSLEIIYYPSEPVVIHVPVDQPNIQAGIDAAVDGDTVLVAAGTYSGPGNDDLRFWGKEIVVISEEGAANTIIDCQGQAPGCVFDNSETNMSELNGFTIKQGADNNGGGVRIHNASPLVRNCLFFDCSASSDGGAAFVDGGSPTFENCTFADNSASQGAALFVDGMGTSVSFSRNVVAFNSNDGIYCAGSASDIDFDCNVFWSNPNGHLAGNCSFPGDVDENTVETDPEFCDRDNDEYSIFVDSPCDPDVSLCGQLIGALETACSDLDFWRVEMPNIELGYMGLIIPVSVYLTAPINPTDLGYIDVCLKWNSSSMAWVDGQPGEFLTECDWEYFTWRLRTSPVWHWEMWTYADLGSAQATCFYPEGKRELIRLRFLLSMSPQWADMWHPIQFYWPDGVGNGCALNAFKNLDFDSLLIGNGAFTFTGYEIDPNTYPDLTPYPDCDSAGTPAIDFHNGAIYFVDLLGADVRADINLNGIRFDIGDFIMFSCYWMNGLDCFTIDLPKQIEATDINCDGIFLSIADYVRMILIMFHGESPLCPDPPLAGPRVETNDTLAMLGGFGERGDKDKPISISLANELDIAGFQSRFEYDPDVLDPVLDTALGDGVSVVYELVGRAADYADFGSLIVQSREAGELLVTFAPDDSLFVNIPAGSGTIINVYFDVKSTAPLGLHTYGPVDDGYEINLLSTADAESIVPELVSGTFFVIREFPNPSCPVLYSFNGSSFVEENPLLTACEQSGYKDVVTDYYHVTSPIAADQGRVRFQLRELEDEVTYLDHVQLITVDHSRTTKVATSVDGSIFTYAETMAPLSVYDHRGTDCLEQVAAADGRLFTADGPGYLIATFANDNAESKGFGLNTALKLKCPQLSPSPPPVPGDGEGAEPVAQLKVEVLGDDGVWVEVDAVPPRQQIRQEVMLSDAISELSSDVITLRISWAESYTTDAIVRYLPAEEQPTVTTWSIDDFELASSSGGVNLWNGFEHDQTLILRKGDMFEFEFQTGELAGNEFEREYIIVATGRYEPDYGVYTDLIPNAVTLYGNYPNPFNPATSISYSTTEAAHVRLEIINVLGQTVATLIDEFQPAGYRTVDWNAAAAASGMYFYRLTVGEFSETKKMMLVK